MTSFYLETILYCYAQNQPVWDLRQRGDVDFSGRDAIVSNGQSTSLNLHNMLY